MIYKDKNVAILIPCLNEETTVAKVVTDFKEALPAADVFVFDNDSTDATITEAESSGSVVVRVPRRGKGNVVREMFRRIDADIYVLVDGDDTYSPKDVGRLIGALIDDDLDMVVGDRLSNSTYDLQNKRRFHSFGNRLVLAVINFLYGADCKDILSGYRVFSRRFVKTCPILVDGFEVETLLSIHALDKKLPTRELPISYKERPEGSVSKLDTFSDGLRILKTIATLFKVYKPLRFFSAIGFLFFGLGLIIGSIPVLEYITTGLVSRFPLAILASALEILATLAFCCGLILDTVARSAREQFELRIMSQSLWKTDSGES